MCKCQGLLCYDTRHDVLFWHGADSSSYQDSFTSLCICIFPLPPTSHPQNTVCGRRCFLCACSALKQPIPCLQHKTRIPANRTLPVVHLPPPHPLLVFVLRVSSSLPLFPHFLLSSLPPTSSLASFHHPCTTRARLPFLHLIPKCLASKQHKQHVATMSRNGSTLSSRCCPDGRRTAT
jgi:hypothetical protein